MTLLILGLVLFLGVHSVRIVADGWRTQQIARLGDRRYKGLYTLTSLLGFGLLLWGFSLARAQPLVLWSPPAWTHPLAAVLMLVAFVLLAAAYVPRNVVKAKLGHPMLLSVKVWGFAHLIANGSLADVLLFGSFLVWAVLCFRSSRRRDRATGTVYPAATASGTALTVAIGAVAYALFAYWLHGWLFGVRPLP